MTAPGEDSSARPGPSGPTAHRRPRAARLAGWVLTALAAGFAVTQCAVLVRRARRGRTDFSIIYRTAEAINDGQDGGLYGRPFDPTWPRSIPPVGTMPFQFLAGLAPGVAAIVWSVAALAVLAGGAAFVGLTVSRLGDRAGDYRAVLPWAIAVTVLLACDCLQTGQFSILFAACWLAYMAAATRGRHVWAGLALAVPAAIKFYPAVMIAVPLAMRKGRQVVSAVAGWVVLTAVVPLCVFGPARAWDLSAGYVRHNFLAADNAVSVRLRTAVASNQAIDVVMLRYLTDDRQFGAEAPQVPHLAWPRDVVLALAQIVRAGILVVAALASWRWIRTPGPDGPRTAVILTALWSATLYLALPETKARYAVYVAPAYLPILAAAAAAARRKCHRALAAWIVLIVASLAAVLYPPKIALHFGLGLAGPIMLFAAMLVLMAGRAGPRKSE